MPPSDDELIERFRQTGDKSAFSEIFARHHRFVYCTCLRLVQNPSAAEDLTQETFMGAYRSIHQYKPNNFRAWLNRIATNLCNTWLRSRKNRQPPGLDELPNDPPDARPPVSTAFDVQEALERISPVQRRTIELFHFEGLSYKEIAALMNISLKAVTSHLQNGLRMLRRQLEKETV